MRTLELVVIGATVGLATLLGLYLASRLSPTAEEQAIRQAKRRVNEP